MRRLFCSFTFLADRTKNSFYRHIRFAKTLRLTGVSPRSGFALAPSLCSAHARCGHKNVLLLNMPHAIFLLSTIYFLILCSVVHAAVGCQLNDPDRDVKRIFSQSTGYRTDFISIQESGGTVIYAMLEKALGDKLDPVYEAMDVPYAFYRILKGKETVGYIHGVNQKGMFGGMQLIVSTDTTGKIIDFYYQKISSPEAGVFMDKKFTAQFIGKNVQDFMQNSVGISDPSKNSTDDFKATLRGLKKNMILLHQLELKDDVLNKEER